MGLFGKLISTPIKILNAPLKALEDVASGGKANDGDRVFSVPLDALAKQLEKVDEDD